MNKNTKTLVTWGALLGLLYWFWKSYQGKKGA